MHREVFLLTMELVGFGFWRKCHLPRLAVLIVSVGGFSCFSPIAGSAEPGKLPALESFFSKSTHFAESLSPDGAQVAYLSEGENGRNILWLVGIDSASGDPRRISFEDHGVVCYFWIGSQFIFWQSSGPEGRVRLFLSDLGKRATREILTEKGKSVSLQGVASAGKPWILIGLADTPTAFPDLYRLDLREGAKPVLLCKNSHEIMAWAWDSKGEAVAGLRWTQAGAKELLRLDDGGARVVFKGEPEDDLRLLSATPDGSRVLVLTNKDTDITRLEFIDLDSGQRTKVAADPLGKLDIGEVIFDSGQGLVLATNYVDVKLRWKSESKTFNQLLHSVSAMPGFDRMICLGFDSDKRRFLIKTITDRDPGTVYLYDLKSRSIRKLWVEQPMIDRSALCKTRRYDYKARDGCRIPAYLTLPLHAEKPWPLVVFPHGGPRMRTSPGYDGRVQFLASRGYAVLQPNFRGSRGYGKKFMNAGDGQWGRGVMQNDITDGVDNLLRKGIVDRRRVAILGGSYGGYAALAGLAFTPMRYAAGISLFGISDLQSYASYAPIEWQAYTGDTVRRLGGAKAFESLEHLSPVNHAASIMAPLLIYHGVKDKLIPVSHANRMVSAMREYGKQVEYLQADDEAHGFSRPESEMAVYRAIEIFLHQHIGGKVGPLPAEAVTARLTQFRRAGKPKPVIDDAGKCR